MKNHLFLLILSPKINGSNLQYWDSLKLGRTPYFYEIEVLLAHSAHSFKIVHCKVNCFSEECVIKPQFPNAIHILFLHMLQVKEIKQKQENWMKQRASKNSGDVPKKNLTSQSPATPGEFNTFQSNNNVCEI